VAVAADAWPVLELFLACQTQWRFIPLGMGGALPQGLDYPAVESAARMLGLSLTPDTFEDLRVMEAEALHGWREKLG
jgi:hypothetical protein